MLREFTQKFTASGNPLFLMRCKGTGLYKEEHHDRKEEVRSTALKGTALLYT